MNITPDLLFLNIHNPFTNERIIVYLVKLIACVWTQMITFLNKHLSKGVVIVASA